MMAASVRRGTGAVWLVGCALTSSATAQAADSCVAPTAWSDSAVAVQLAPVLHFAPGEHYFPTLPFLAALTLGAEGREVLGWSPAPPPVEVVPRHEPAVVARIDDLFRATGAGVAFQTPKRPPGDTLLSLRRLDSLYRTHGRVDPVGIRLEPPPGAAVFYRSSRRVQGRALTAFWRFLENDPLAWRRMWRESSLDPDSLNEVPLRVVEYYFYYLRDQGLVGHPDDREMVYVFIPDEPRLFCAFRVVVGSGHSTRTPNNILVTDSGGIHGRPHVLVELGGHSSAPDLPPYGRFQPGIDATWNLHHGWGTRDVQAISGFGWAGRYSPDMTIRRDTLSAVTLRPDWADSAKNTFRYRLIPVPVAESLSVAAERLCPSHPTTRPASHASRWAWPVGCDEARAAAVQQADRLGAWIGMAGSAAGAPGLEAHLRGLTGDWAWGLRHDPPIRAGRDHHEIWRHDQYRQSPVVILKPHLVPPAANRTRLRDLPRHTTWGLGWWPFEALSAYVGMVIPKPTLPIYLPGFLEVQGGVVATDGNRGASRLLETRFRRTSASLALLYENGFETYVSWYMRLQLVTHPQGVLDPTTGGYGSFSVGPSFNFLLRPSGPAHVLWNVLRLRTGLRFALDTPSRLSRVDLDLQLELRQ